MTRTALTETLALGAVTGMRTTAGLTALALRRRGFTGPMMLAMAAGEMIADKTPVVGDRIAPLPLAGRMVTGAIVGGLIARESRGNLLLGALTGAAAAAVAAHLAYRARRTLASGAVGGVVEDLIVVGVGALAAAAHRR